MRKRIIYEAKCPSCDNNKWLVLDTTSCFPEHYTPQFFDESEQRWVRRRCHTSSRPYYFFEEEQL